MMGGSIWVKSEAGVGSTFLVHRLPGIGAATEHRKVVPEELNGARVLVVDDNPGAREVLVELLAALPFAVDQVASGAGSGRGRSPGGRKPLPDRVHGLEDAGHVRIEAARLIKAGDGAQAPAVIMVTAFGREDVRRKPTKRA
jgi:CheY-like chemotaxis protein